MSLGVSTLTDHYFSSTPSAISQPRSVHFQVRGLEVTLTTDAGVFSKTGLDFGTRLLLETVDIPPSSRCVDLGCGYGVVGRVLGQVYPDSTWTLVDINPRAVELAKQNTASFGNRIRVAEADGVKDVVAVADAVVLNPPIRAGKVVVYRLFEESRDVLCNGGSLWVVIHKKHGAESALRKLEELFASVKRANRKSGYNVYKCIR